MSSSCLRLFTLIPAMLGATAAWSADPACKPLEEIKARLATVPVHIYETETGTHARSREMVYLNNKVYMQVNGKWRTMPMTPKDIEEAGKEVNGNSTLTCKALGSEAVGGEASALYSTHDKTPDATIDTQVWISKSRSLPLKVEMDMVMAGSGAKSHRSVRTVTCAATCPLRSASASGRSSDRA